MAPSQNHANNLRQADLGAKLDPYQDPEFLKQDIKAEEDQGTYNGYNEALLYIYLSASYAVPE